MNTVDNTNFDPLKWAEEFATNIAKSWLELTPEDPRTEEELKDEILQRILNVLFRRK